MRAAALAVIAVVLYAFASADTAFEPCSTDTECETLFSKSLPAVSVANPFQE